MEEKKYNGTVRYGWNLGYFARLHPAYSGFGYIEGFVSIQVCQNSTSNMAYNAGSRSHFDHTPLNPNC